MMYRVERVDPAMVSEADLASWHHARTAGLADDLPDDPSPTLAEVVADLRPAGGGERLLWFARDEAGEVVGDAYLDLYGEENADLGEIVVRVRTDARRRGIGTRLYDAALRSARDSGRTRTRSWTVDHPGPTAFARSLGMSHGGTEVRSVLRVAETRPTGSAARSDGFTVARWTGHCPEELVEGYAAVLHGLNDAPSSLSPRAWSAARVREREERRARRGVGVFVVAAREAATGALAGYTEVAAWPGQYRAHQWGTTVSPEFRGRGLGLWMKAAMIEWLRLERPEVTEYQTFNSDENPYMIAVNERLGYRPVDRWMTWLREI